MSNAKSVLINTINSLPDSMNEIELVNSLYHRLRLDQSRKSIDEYGTLSTDEVREYFIQKHAEKRV